MQVSTTRHTDSYDLCTGNVRLQPGDVLMLSGREHGVIYVNQSRAVVRALGKQTHTLRDGLNGKDVTFTSNASAFNISTQVEAASVVRRMSGDELQQFTGNWRGAGQPVPTTTPTAAETTGEATDMSSKRQKKLAKKRARGGLAAAALARQEKEGAEGNLPAKERKTKKVKASIGEHKPGTGRMEKIFDCSVCSVVRRLGKEGVTIEHAKLILAERNITMPPTSLSVQLGYGRSGKRPAAELTDAQVKELVKSAKAPEPEPEKETAAV